LNIAHRQPLIAYGAMTYSDADLAEIPRDRARLRAWWWRMAQHHKRLAKQYRRESKMTAIEHSPVGYRPAFDEGADLIHWAGILDHLSEIVLDNLDALVESSYEGGPPGVPGVNSYGR
jgi:hypothetical protein